MRNDRQFGRWLEKQLARREWRAADFARRLGVGNSTVTMWLRGERVPTPESCHRIAYALDKDPNEVLEAAGHIEPGPMSHLERWHAALDPLLRKIPFDDEHVFSMRSEAERIIQIREFRAGKRTAEQLWDPVEADDDEEE